MVEAIRPLYPGGVTRTGVFVLAGEGRTAPFADTSGVYSAAIREYPPGVFRTTRIPVSTQPTHFVRHHAEMVIAMLLRPAEYTCGVHAVGQVEQVAA
jgi:hypothetical protein